MASFIQLSYYLVWYKSRYYIKYIKIKVNFSGFKMQLKLRSYLILFIKVIKNITKF